MTHHSEPAEAVACLYTVQGDSQPFMRISRGMLAVAGDIVAVQPLGPLPASPAPAAGGLEAVLDHERIPSWPPLKHALWMVVTGEKLNDGHYINAYQLTDKLYAAALAAPAATSGPTYVVNCCNCGRIIDTREESEGGDQWGHELSDDRWVCSPECLDAVADPDATSAATRGEPVAWMCHDLILDDVVFSRDAEHCARRAARKDEWRVEPLYATPPAPAESAQVKEALIARARHAARVERTLTGNHAGELYDALADALDECDPAGRIRSALATDAEG